MSNRGGSNRGQGRKKLNNFNPDNYDSNAFASLFRLKKNDDSKKEILWSSAGVWVGYSVVNNSAFPGNVEPGFVTFAAAGVKLPVDCNVSGKFVPLNAPPSYIEGALLDNGSGPVVHTYDFTAAPEFTANYTFSVGIVRRINSGAGATFDVVAQQDMSVPFRYKYTGTAISFSCDFQFEMENRDPATGNPQDYVPFMNHNGVVLPNSNGILQYQYVRVSFTTKNNV